MKEKPISNGEIDGAVCDIGTSRWFNYYLEVRFSLFISVISDRFPIPPLCCIFHEEMNGEMTLLGPAPIGRIAATYGRDLL